MQRYLRRGSAHASGLMVALGVLILGGVAGYFYQDNLVLAPVSTTSVVTTKTSMVSGNLTTATTTELVRTTLTSADRVTSTLTLRNVSYFTVTSTMTTASGTVTDTVTTTAVSSQVVVSTVTVTHTPAAPSAVTVSGSVSAKTGTLTGIFFGSTPGTINGGSYSVSLPNPGTYTVTLDYTQGGAKTCTAGTIALDLQAPGSVTASWSC